MLRVIINLASGDTLYCSKTIDGFFISTFLNSGSLAALSNISLIISASFCRASKQKHERAKQYITLVHN